ncbi:SH2 domain-containing protein A-like isoform X2 [Vicia villosa]|nr:SH2 domain-containing protein A-like isoform X2 [Vicia villosa]
MLLAIPKKASAITLALSNSVSVWVEYWLFTSVFNGIPTLRQSSQRRSGLMGVFLWMQCDPNFLDLQRLYPVVCVISRDWVNPIWNSFSPKWIEGFITKEDAEASLQGPAGFQEPGTFILRGPTSRSWPHPDVGSLTITYVSSDYKLCHRLLSMDHIYSSDKTGVKPLQDMLLADPELTRLGRVMRRYQAR